MRDLDKQLIEQLEFLSEKDVEDMGKWISNFLQEHKP